MEKKNEGNYHKGYFEEIEFSFILIKVNWKIFGKKIKKMEKRKKLCLMGIFMK